VAAIWTVALLAYSNSFRAGLTFDSASVIGRDARVHASTARNVDLIWSRDYWYKIGTPGLYRPLTTSSYLFNYAILDNGPNPAGYHWVNFGLHAINILLVYALAFLLSGEVPPAAATAALWGLHPVAVEAVTNIVGRADLLAALGVLTGLLCHIRAGDLGPAKRRAVWLLALMLAAAIGLLSKENALVLPALMLAYDLGVRRGADAVRPCWRRLLPGYVALAPPLVLFFVLRARALSRVAFLVTDFLDNPLTGAGFWTARITALKILGKYLYLLLWPAHLCANYSYNQIPLFNWRFDSWESWKAVVALTAWCAVLWIGVRAFRVRGRVFFWIAFFVVALAPTSNLIILIGSIMAERFLYLPSVGFAGLMVAAAYAGCGRLARKWPALRKAALLVLAAVCLAFAARVYARNRDWLDDKTLWTHDVRESPESFKTHFALAEALWQEGSASLDRATSEHEKAVSIVQDLPEARQSARELAALGICYRQKGEALAAQGGDLSRQSRAWYTQSVVVLMRAERVARAHSEEITGADVLPRIYLELGRTYRSLAQPAQALEAFAAGRRLAPDIAFFAEIARTYEALGDPRRAATSLLEGLAADPVQTGFASKAVDLLRQADPRSCASLAGGKLNLACPALRYALCAAGWNVLKLYLETGRRDEAAAIRSNTLDALNCPAEPAPVSTR
jgi:tetratricopeptide (TPR) repeat protein